MVHRMKNSLSRVGFAFALIAGLLTPAVAMASKDSDWTISNSITNATTNPGEKIPINIAQCRDLFDSDSDVLFVLTLSGDASVSSDAVYTLKYAVGNESCSKNDLEEVSGDSCITIASKQTLTHAASPLQIYRNVDTLSSAKDADTCEGLAESSYLYLIVSDPENGIENKYTVTMELDFRTTRPDAPSGISVTAGGESLKVEWDSVYGADKYKVYYSNDEFTSGANPEDVSANTATASSSKITIKDKVSAGNTYYISVTALDSRGNESKIGEVVTVETVASKDFWDTYRADHQDVDGGFFFIATASYVSTQ